MSNIIKDFQCFMELFKKIKVARFFIETRCIHEAQVPPNLIHFYMDVT